MVVASCTSLLKLQGQLIPAERETIKFYPKQVFRLCGSARTEQCMRTVVALHTEKRDTPWLGWIYQVGALNLL
jgi:hypothetical protein